MTRRAKEIIQTVKKMRGESGADRKRWGVQNPNVSGHCVESAEVARRLGGQHWRSDEAVVAREQVYPGHSVAVVRTRGRAGVIVAYDDPKKTIVDGVRNVEDAEEVKGKLASRFGGGVSWRRVK
jgi:hypothetical protein